MAGNIKGITIEFNGDTTKLGNALRDINKQTKDVDKALKDVNTALKFNPGNTELIAQKQVLLRQKIEQTKEKLDVLREAQAKLDDDPSVDKTSQEYMELRREIIQTESKLSHFESELKKLDNIKFEQIGKRVQEIGGKMETVGKGMSKYVTAPIVAGAAASVKAWQEVDNGLDIVTQKTGATGDKLAGMQDIVKNLAGEVPADFETIGSAVGEVNTRFGLQGDALQDLSGKYIKFAQLNEQDVSTAVDKTQKALQAFNLDSDAAGPLLDTLNKVGQDTGVSMDTLEESLVKNAGALQQMGMGIDESAVFLGQLEVSGVDADKAMVGLNKALVAGAKEGKDFPTVLNDLQKSIAGATTDAEAMSVASEYFGTKAGPAMAQAIRNGTLDLSDLSGASLDAKDNLTKTFEETLDPADKFTLMMNELKVMGYEVADVMFTMLEPALKTLVAKAKELREAWAKLSPEQQKMILKIAGIAAAIGPLLVVFGKLTTGIGGLITNIPKITGAVGALGGKMGLLKTGAEGAGGGLGKLFGIVKAHPLLILAAALAALTGAFIASGGDVDAFKEKLVGLATKATEFIQEVAKKLPEMIPVIAEAAKALFTTIAEALPQILPPLLQALTDLIMALVAAIPDLVPVLLNGAITLFMALVDAIPTIMDALIKAMSNLIVTLIANFPAFYKSLLAAMPKLWGALWEGFKTIAGTILSYIPKFVASVASSLGDKLSGVWKKIKETASKAWDTIKKTIVDIVKKLITDAVEKVTGFAETIHKKWEDIKDTAQDLWEKLKDAVVGIVKKLIEAVVDYFKNLFNTYKEIFTSIFEFGKDIWNKLKEKVVDIVDGLKTRLSDAWSAIKRTAGDTWERISDTILRPIQNMKEKIRDIVNTIKGWFSNFHIRTPDIKLPHPEISPPGWTLSDLLDGITPSIDLRWYKTGGIFDSPTIAGIGEAGAEAVVPLDKFWAKMDQMSDSIVNGLLIGLRTMQMQGAGPENVTIPIYLYPSGPKMGEETVKMYDEYKRRLG